MKVSLNQITLPIAALGSDNPLPPLGRPQLVTVPADLSAADPEMARNLAYGKPPTLLPYTVQDGYTRNLADGQLRTAVVENEILRAEFLLDYGGRMWSLQHKPTGRELLHRNPVLQPANLGLRNAWFAGGVEWNLGTTGHTPLTCAPVHAACVERPDGVPVLRLWEFERMRELVYQLDVCAPPGSPVLQVHVRISNPNAFEAPVYWWSNIAVPEHDRTRVLAPARQAWHLAVDGVLHKVVAPAGYAADFLHAADHFYDIPADVEQPWIAAVNADGIGLAQTSTARLRGRKLFVWGRSSGGQRWQEWLSPPDHRYLEIQAGLARTQLEHLPLPAGESWSWTETYGLIETDPALAHSPDWTVAVQHVAAQLHPIASAPEEWLDLPPAERLHRGSGWGALERRVRASSTSLRLSGTPFDDDTLGREQSSWLILLESGTMLAPAPRLSPASYQVSPSWLDLLEQADPHNWFTLLHLGVARWHHGDVPGATDAWERSHGATPNPWALRNLAVAEPATAIDRLRVAHGMAPGSKALAVEAIQAMLAAGEADEALAFIDRMMLDMRHHGRILLLECRAALDAGRLDRAARIVDTGIVVDDLREGEDALDELWFRYHTQRGTTPVPQLPCLYDFRTAAP